MKKRPEITWSLLHPRKPEPDYVRAVLAAAAPYQVDSFELCGEAHLQSGGIDGAIFFRAYPAAAAQLDRAAVAATIALLRESIAVAHAAGRPVYYWHREVMVPRAVVAAVPGLLDENGEFDLLGAAYHQLLRAKITEFFDHLPDLDGVVLTLTESDYSVIHNSNPRRYPPADVVRAVVTTFATELRRRGKRFVLRSFGSIAQDYRDILAGAAAVEEQFDFEVETKITPYDFSPFLELNPFLRRTGRALLSAEYDSIGEFLGAGYLPAPDPARVIECVRHAQQQGVDRHVIRVDRIGHATFSSTQAINLHAFDRAIRDPGVTADDIWREWAAAHWPDGAPGMVALMRTGIELVKKTHFIDGHLIFHAFPIDPTMKWIKAAGILGVFTPGVSLARQDGMWGIDPARTTPAHATLLREKDEAVSLADDGWRGVQALKPRLPAPEYAIAAAAWQNATIVTRLIRAWCRCLCAYVADMTGGSADHPALSTAIASARDDFARVIDLGAGAPRKPAATDLTASEYGGRERGDQGIEHAYAHPLWTLVQTLPEEFAAEWAERAAWRAQPGLADVIICGGITDDARVRRSMHASHAKLIGGRPARAAGNRVFPNGFIEMELAVPRARPFRLAVRGDRGASRGFRLTVGGTTEDVAYDATGSYERRFAAATHPLRVTIQKTGADYPWIFAIATLTDATTAA